MLITAIIQARMGSSRLPGKVMMKIEGKPLIGHIFDRIKRVNGIQKKVYLASTLDKKNDILVDYALSQNIEVYRHEEEEDILGRLDKVIELSNANALLKVNGDCPLIDYSLLNIAVNLFKKKPDLDLLTNKKSKTFPLGYSYELVNSKAIKWCKNNLETEEDRELVMLWIMNNKKVFPKQYSIYNEINYGNYNLSVDTKKDMDLVLFIFKNLYKSNKYFGLKEVMNFLTTKNIA